MARRWWENASCRGLGAVDDMFFPETGQQGGKVAPSATIARMCYDCPVKWECRVEGYAENNGYFGNMTEIDRRRKRWAIFGRLYWMDEEQDTDREHLRQVVRDIATDMGDDPTVALAKHGLNRREISLFMERSHMDDTAERSIAVQEGSVTDGRWRVNLHGGARKIV